MDEQSGRDECDVVEKLVALDRDNLPPALRMDQLRKAPRIGIADLTKRRGRYRVQLDGEISHYAEAHQAVLSLLGKSHMHLLKEELVLVAKFTHAPISLGKTQRMGGVFLEDESGHCVPCVTQGSYEMFALLDHWVLLTNWNFISSGEFSYVEVEKMICPKFSSGKVTAQKILQAISVEDAFLTLKHRDALSPGLINVCGMVTAVSEVIRMKLEHLFLIQLAENDVDEEMSVHIIVKDIDQLHWHRYMYPQKEYVFTKLRATTVQKGTAVPVKVFVTRDGGEFVPRSECTCEVIGLEDWLGVEKLPPGVRIGKPIPDQPADSLQKLYTYQGIITDVSECNMGLYELDHKIRLYLSFVPAAHKFLWLRPGTKVLVYNAHHKGSSKPPRIRLAACMKSCVRVMGFSPFESVCKDMVVSQSASLSLIYDHSLNLSQFEHLLELEKTMANKVGEANKRESGISVPKLLLAALLKPSPVRQRWGTGGAPRTLLQEFLSPEQSCTLLRPSQTGCSMPDMPLIMPLHGEASSLQVSLQSLKEKYSQLQRSGQQLNDQLYWNYTLTEQSDIGKMIIGYLRPSPKTGQVQLVDMSGTMDVIITCHHGDQEEHECSKHRCLDKQYGSSKHCSESSESAAKKCDPCPFMQTSDLSSLVRVDRYQMVMEQFHLTSYPTVKHIGDPGYVRKSRIHAYVMFSMKDIVILKRPSASRDDKPVIEQPANQNIPVNPTQLTSLKRKHCADFSARSDTATKQVCRVFYVNQKESLLVQHRVSGTPGLRFCAVGYLFSTGTKNEADSDSSSSSVCTCDRDGQLNSKQSRSDNVAKTALPGGASVHVRTTGNASVAPRHVILVFDGDVISSYHLLNSGHFYQIELPSSDVSVFEPKYFTSTVKSAVEKSKARECIVVPHGVSIQRLNVLTGVSKEFVVQDRTLHISEPTLQQMVMDEVTRFHSFEDVSSGRCGVSLVSLYGRIVSRTHPESDSLSSTSQAKLHSGHRIQQINSELGVSTLDNRCIKLELEDVEQTQCLCVYMNLQNTAYPLGLLPGTLVELRHLERKVSKKGSVYCQYITVSTVKVHQMPLGDIKDIGASKEYKRPTSWTTPQENLNLDSAPLYHLGNLWSPDTQCEVPPVFYSVCHILQALRVSLKAVCSQCGRETNSSGCSTPGCSGLGGWLLARASFLVDDGTSTCIASCRGDTVHKVLGLSASQWHVVENKITEHGELFVQNRQGSSERSYHPLAEFFSSLCDSPVVKQQWKMLFSTAKHWASKGVVGPDTHSLSMDEFALKTMNTGTAQFETRCLPFLQLDCVGVEKVNVTSLILQHLCSMNK